MKNLYKETISLMRSRKKGIEDIAWIGDDLFSIPIQFMEDAFNIEYNNDYGEQEINPNLIIMFRDGTWLSRWWHEKREGWVYHALPSTIKEGKHKCPHWRFALDMVKNDCDEW